MKWLVLILTLLLPGGSGGAQTVTPATLGMNYITPTTTTSKVFASIQRILGNFIVGTGSSWSQIDTCIGTYSWSTIDAIVASAQSQGQDVIYVFNDVPNCANGNQGTAVPPTDFNSFYTFVTAVVTRYKGRIKYYETWNEANLSSEWTGTQGQMLLFAQNVYSIVHAIDPSAVVLSPSVTGFSGISWMQQFLAIGAGSYADEIAVHTYPIQSTLNPPNESPEQEWLICQNYQAMLSANSVAKPIIVTEGSWFTNPSTITTQAAQTIWAALWPLLTTSCGASRVLWFAYDGDNANGGLGDGATWLNQQGVAYRNMIGWLSGATWSSPAARIPATNQIRNTIMTGAVAGTPGTLPTNWTLSNSDITHGISTQIVGTGTESGVPYLDFRVFGTPTAGAGGFVGVTMEAINQIVASLGQQWTFGADVKLVAGSSYTSGLSVVLTFNEWSSGGSFLGQSLNYPFFPGSATLPGDIQQWPAVTVSPSVAFVAPTLIVQYSTSPVAIDITLRIGAPFLDTGSLWSGTLTKPGGYQAQIIWDSSGGPSSYSPSGTYTYRRDTSGNSMPIAGNVTLTNLPTLLENQQWKGWTP